MDYFILGLWGATLVIVCVILYKVNNILNGLYYYFKSFEEQIKDVEKIKDSINDKLNTSRSDANENLNIVLDRIAELTGTVTTSGGKICKILDIVDAKDKIFITATDTCKSDQSIKTRKAKNSKVSKKAIVVSNKFKKIK